jgi:hypothetical protein
MFISAAGISSTNKVEEVERVLLLPPLPDEVAEGIFLRLRPKLVAASRCVSPTWNNLFSSAAFADRYHAARTRTVPVLVTLSTTKPAKEERAFCCGKACHGAVLVGRPHLGAFRLCDPSTGGALPLPPRCHPPWCVLIAGLGYDARARAHKAVLLEDLDGLVRPREKRVQCLVFAVGAAQWRWRGPRGGRNKTPGVVCGKGEAVSIRTDPVFADGCLHWMLPLMVNLYPEEHSGILAFAVSAESFRRLPRPLLAVDGTRPVRATLAELDGHLFFVHDLRRREDAVALFELWTLRGSDDSSDLSWSLDRRVDLTPHVGRELQSPWCGDFFVVCHVGGGESRRILLATAQREYMYAPDTGELRSMGRRASCGGRDVNNGRLSLVLYQESLLQLPGMEYGDKGVRFNFNRGHQGFLEPTMFE